MLKYDVLMLRAAILLTALLVLDSIPKFMFKFIRDSDVQALAGKLDLECKKIDKQLFELDKQFEENAKKI